MKTELGFSADQPAHAQTAAWHAFLEAYAPVLYQVIRPFERDEDRIADAFLFVCEGLAKDRFGRLRSFDPQGSASFAGWLRAVTRNLYLDWRRSRFGRQRAFEVVGRLPLLDQEVYRCLYVEKLSVAETLGTLRTSYPSLSAERVEESAELLAAQLTSAQQWRLQSRSPRVLSLDAQDRSGRGRTTAEASDTKAPDPEHAASSREEAEHLRAALRRLEPRQRLLLRLRFDEERPLREVARLMGYSNPQQADRSIRAALSRLRSELSEKSVGATGKGGRLSV